MEIEMEIEKREVHHEFGPSRLPMYMACPGAYRMQKGIEETASPEAMEGSLLHERVAAGSKEGLDGEQEAMVEACLGFLAETAGDGATVHKELPVSVRDEDGGLLTEGTCDVAIEYPDKRLAVIDWKFGRVPVAEVNRNMQLAAYAVGAMQTLGYDACECHVYQPRIYAHSAYTFAKPGAIVANIRNIIARCTDDGLMLRPGDQCGYCRAKGKCPAFMAMFRSLANPEDDWKASPDMIAEYYARSKVVEKFCREVRTALEARIDADGRCGPYIYKERPGNREIGDVQGAFGALRDSLTQGEFLAQGRFSVSGLVDAVAGKLQARAEASGAKMTKVAARGEAEGMLEPFIQRGAAVRTIVEG
jgi:hypothetical protein